MFLSAKTVMCFPYTNKEPENGQVVLTTESAESEKHFKSCYKQKIITTLPKQLILFPIMAYLMAEYTKTDNFEQQWKNQHIWFV